MTMKAHTYYIIFGRPPIGGKASPPGGATATHGCLAQLSQYHKRDLDQFSDISVGLAVVTVAPCGLGGVVE